ncbi:hypothetical protein MMC27_005276 [Xylographa pallens]|nr:hypothetical protein [Xylographa pallens]
MHFTKALKVLVSASLVHLSIAGYILEDDYSAANFFSMFNFQTETDPTGGYVNYLDQPTAQSDGLINTNNGLVYIGVDSTNVASGRGRNSVRLESKKAYNHALVVLDLAHMPAGCGTWPAFWTFGPGWPNGGEIDIVEGVNDQATNSMTLHTSDGCSANSPASAFTGQQNTYNCYVKAANQSENEGCGFSTTASNSYGTGFNNNGGGVYAMEWTSNYIQIFFWPGGSAPSDALGDTPNPSGWGRPAAIFQGDCDIDQYFMDQQITFDMTFCGSWAGAAWGGNCAAQNGNSCNAFVQNTPSAFKETYWSVNSLRVYQNSPTSNTAPSAASKPQPAAIPAAISVASSAAPASQPTSTASTPTSTPIASSSASISSLSAQAIAHSGPITVTAAPVVITVAAPSSTLMPKVSSVYSSQPAQTLDVLPSDAEVLQSDEFGAGSPGIPDPWRRKHRRHLAQHVRSAHAHF